MAVLNGTPKTVSELLACAAEQFGDRDAVVAGSQRLTFRGWWEAGGGLATELAERETQRGDVVAVMLPSSIDYAISYAAAIRLGAVVTGLNPRLGPAEIASIFAKTDPAVVICEPETVGKLPERATNQILPRSEMVDTYGRAPSEPVAVTPEEPVAIVWTSGTTGLPKGAWFDHAALKGTASAAGNMTRPFDRRLLPIPFVHAGFMTKLWDTVAAANAIILTPTPWTAEAMLDILERERITVAGAVPTQWSKLLALPQLDPDRLTSLRIAVTSTAPTPPELVREIAERLGCPVVVRYATTESSVGTGTRLDDSPEAIFRTVGRPQDGVDLAIVDDERRTIPTGEVGTVKLRNEGQMRGYWRDPERTAEVIDEDGWVVTGDAGYIRADGNLVLVGRTTDMYIRGGYNVYPLEVENALGLHPKLAEVAVVGHPAPVIGEIGVAVAVASDPDAPPTLEELRDFARQRIADYKAPDRLVLVDALPRNATLKVHRPALRELVEQHS